MIISILSVSPTMEPEDGIASPTPIMEDTTGYITLQTEGPPTTLQEAPGPAHPTPE